jgi:hypothetical protein
MEHGWNGNWEETLKYSEKNNWPTAILSTKNPTWTAWYLFRISTAKNVNGLHV